MEITSEMILEAANKTGFGLEFKVSQILDNNGYTIKFNEEIRADGHTQQVDILAWKTRYQELLIECKGAREDSALILIKEPKSKTLNPSKELGNPPINKTDFKLIQVFYDIEKVTNTWLTFTGDFYHLKKEGKNNILNRTPTNIEGGNFYKAQTQLAEAIWINAQSKNKLESQYQKNISPIIITNSELWVVDCEENTSKKYKWVLHKTSQQNQLLNLQVNDKLRYWHITPIVNICYFPDFLSEYDDYINKNQWSQNINIQIPEGAIQG